MPIPLTTFIVNGIGQHIVFDQGCELPWTTTTLRVYDVPVQDGVPGVYDVPPPGVVQVDLGRTLYGVPGAYDVPFQDDVRSAGALPVFENRYLGMMLDFS